LTSFCLSNQNRWKISSSFYSVFQGFRKAKSANGGSVLSSSQFFSTASAASKNGACFKSGQS
jgi:hypothetical protein